MSEIQKRCTEIADRVEPGFRVTGQRSCTSHAAKRWNAAYEAARLALSAADLQPAPSVAVKALEWQRVVGDVEVAGSYKLDRMRPWTGSKPKKYWVQIALGFGFKTIATLCETVEEAKAAAQADYEARILSALSAQVQDVASMADEIEKIDIDYNISEFYGLSDWAAFAAGVAKGRAAAAELVRAKGSARQDERGHNLGQLEIHLQRLIEADLHKARMASNNEDLRMWFVSELISEASGQIPLLEIEGLVSRQLAAVKGGDA